MNEMKLEINYNINKKYFWKAQKHWNYIGASVQKSLNDKCSVENKLSLEHSDRKFCLKTREFL